jgi:hypothetical protein
VRWLVKNLIVPGLVLIACSSAWAASSYITDSDTSTRLTDYLHSHRLPLVGAQVLNSNAGRSVMLYGYTATEFGKNDAETKTRRFLRDSEVIINNHIRVQPELASMPQAPPSAAPPPNSSAGAPPPDQLGDIDSYKNQQQDNTQQQYMNQQAQQYMNQGTGLGGMPNSALSILIPLMGMGMGIGGGGATFGFGGGSPGFGGGFGNSYGGGGFGSPYGGGYGSPYGGANPYGPSPYGASPYGPGPGNPYP